MKLTLEEMKEIAKRLPIGYYLGTKAQVHVEPSGGAYCDVVKHDIYIGLPLLQTAADHIKPEDASKWDREVMLRCLLYHEVGHLLLTPQWLSEVKAYRNWASAGACGTTYSDSRSLLNIFEDERLEQMLSSFFIGVDFKGFARLVNETDKAAAKSEVNRFFDAVRLRHTTPEKSALIDDTIESLSRITAATEIWGAFNTYQSKFNSLIAELLAELLKEDEPKKTEDGKGESESEPESKPEDGESESEPKPEDGEGEGGKSKTEGESDKPEEDKTESDRDDGGESESKGDGKSKPEDGKGVDVDGDSTAFVGGDGKGRGKGDAPSAKVGEIDDDGDAVKPRTISLPKDFLASAAKELFVEPTGDVSKTLNRFASRLSKKRGSQAAGCWSGLHGRISTKRDAMDKERIFRRSTDIGEMLMSAINLTLWVDVSGSFAGSKGELNQILSAAAKAMGMSNGKLNVNVVKMGDHARVAKQREWYVNPDECNSIDMTYYKSWLATRKKGHRNIDIVVFDGDMKSDERVNSETMPDGKTSIESVIWDHPDCHIITDTSNERYLNPLRKAHITYVTGRYANRLQAEVIKTLDRIL